MLLNAGRLAKVSMRPQKYLHVMNWTSRKAQVEPNTAQNVTTNIRSVHSASFRKTNGLEMTDSIEGQGWRVESLRVTIFFDQSAIISQQDWYEKCLSVTPETTEYRRAEGMQIDTGILDGHRYTLQVQRGRADWLITTALIVPDPTQSDLGGYELFPKILEGFRDWLLEIDSVIRIAIGVVGRLQAKSKEHSYQLLQKFLPSMTIDPDSSEFNYRINRPREFEISPGQNILINRISAWGAVVLRQLQPFVIGPNNGGMNLLDLGEWMRCEIDISSDANRSEIIDPSQKRALFDKLIEICVEIFNKGDVK